MQKQTMKKISGLALGSSMLLLSMIPAASAFAATAPAVTSVTLTSSANGSATAGSNVTFTASATQTGSGTPMYQFWTEAPNGTWTATGWSSSNTYTLKNVQTGSYEVVAYAKDKGQTMPISSESTYSNQFVNVGTSLSFTTNANDVAPLSPVTITATAKNFTNVVYQYWIGTPNGNGGYNWVANGDYTPSNTYTFTPSNSGNYQIAVYAKDLNAPQNASFAKASSAKEAVYGAPAGVQLKAQKATLTADGTAQDTVTATVVDANGNTVANYNGTIEVTDSLGLTGAKGYGLIDAAGNFVDANTPTTYTVKNGTVTFAVGASSIATDVQTLTASNLNPVSSATLNYGTLTIDQAAPTAAQIALTAPQQYVTSNSSTGYQFTATSEDQAGNTFSGTGSVPVTFTLTGPGSFTPGATSTANATTSTTLYVPNGGSIPLEVYNIQGSNGTISVTASASGLKGSTATMYAVQTGAPAQIGVTSATTTLANNQSVTTTGGSPVTLQAGTTITKYTVQLEDSAGAPVAPPTAGDSVTVSDSTTANGGSEALYYFAAGTAPAQLGTQFTNGTVQLNNLGQATFYVMNTATQSSPATLTFTDALTGNKQTATYGFVAGPASAIDVTGQATVETNSTETYTAQIADAAGNPIAVAGQTVTFSLGSNADGVTLAGANTSGDVVATTNAQGQATVTVDVPSGLPSQATSSSYTVDAAATVNNVALTDVPQAVTVQPPANYVSQLAASWNAALPTNDTLTSSGSPETVTVNEENGVQTTLTPSDTITVTTSNPSVLSLNSGTTSSISLTPASGSLPTFTVSPGKAGTATITISDASNPSVKPITQTLTVQAGPASQVSVLAPNGTFDGAFTLPTSGVVGPFTLEVTDAGGNVVTNGTPIVLSSTEVLNMIGATGATGIRLSTTGSDVSSITLAPNQTSVQVYLDGATSGQAITSTPFVFGTLMPSASLTAAPETGSDNTSTNTAYAASLSDIATYTDGAVNFFLPQVNSAGLATYPDGKTIDLATEAPGSGSTADTGYAGVSVAVPSAMSAAAYVTLYKNGVEVGTGSAVTDAGANNGTISIFVPVGTKNATTDTWSAASSISTTTWTFVYSSAANGGGTVSGTYTVTTGQS